MLMSDADRQWACYEVVSKGLLNTKALDIRASRIMRNVAMGMLMA
jgi:hypothetical protein